MIDDLPAMNLAFGQQSSVLVYGDFENRDDALIRMHSICHTGIFLVHSAVTVVINYMNL